MILEASDEIEQMDQFLEEMAFNAESIVKNQSRASINNFLKLKLIESVI